MARKAGAEDLPPPDHNNPPKPPTDDERAQLLIVHLKQHRLLDKELEDAMNVVRGINKRRKRVRNDIKSDGFTLKYVDEVLHDEKKARHETEEDARNRTFIRRVARQPITGQPNDDQLDLFAVKTKNGDVSLDGEDAYWAGIGLQIGLRGDVVSHDPADHEVPPERVQAFQQGLAAATAAIVSASKTFQEIEKRRQAEAPDGE